MQRWGLFLWCVKESMHLHGFLLGIMSAKWNSCIKGYMNADDGLVTLSGTKTMLGRDPRKSGMKH